MVPPMSASRGTFMKHLITAAMLACASPVLAAPYTAIYVFGDSLSDRGNPAETGFVQSSAGRPIANYPNPPSNHDSFINGPVAVQVLAGQTPPVPAPAGAATAGLIARAGWRSRV